MVEFKWNNPTDRFARLNTENQMEARQLRRDKMMAKKEIVDQYMEGYNKLIDETIKQHNAKIYGSLRDFLESHKLKLKNAASKTTQHRTSRLGSLASNVQKEYASQVPTCFVITNSESASSIDTQFSAMETELEKEVKAINVQLDEKKCATMKSTIELIQMKLRAMLGMEVSGDTKYDDFDVPITDQDKIQIKEEAESSDDDEYGEEDADEVEESDRIDSSEEDKEEPM